MHLCIDFCADYDDGGLAASAASDLDTKISAGGVFNPGVYGFESVD